jgi:GDPmannose 4,6-dehydratase
MNTPTALITGITGQDGSYLAELLLSKGYEVHGLIRKSSTFNTGRIDHIYLDPHNPDTHLHLHYSDLTDGLSLAGLIYKLQPTEVYNLGAQSHVRVSFDTPVYTGQVTGLGATNLLEAVKVVNPAIRYYQASSSEMFGGLYHGNTIIDEKTPFHPRSPYGCAKAYAYWITVNYRESYGLHASNGILFNHESPRRNETFVTRKITCAVAKIAKGKQRLLYLGNLNSKRDWGYAKDYVEAMWMMLQQDKPDDYVIATGEAHSVQEFVEAAFSYAKLDWKKHIMHDTHYLRPAEVDILIGDSSKARTILGWKPTVTFTDLVAMMVEADLQSV